MSSRSRQSAARPTPSRRSAVPTPAHGTPARRPAVEDELPPYKKPSHPLDERAQMKLRALNDRSIAQLKDHNQKAGDRVTDAAGLILDTLHERQEAVARQRARSENHEEDEARLASLQEQVEDYIEKLEESMRAVIDSSVATQRIEESLDWLRTHAPGQLERAYEMQRSQQLSQRASQSRRRRTQNEDEDEDEDEDMEGEGETQESMGPTPGPTPLDGSRTNLTGASEMYAQRLQRQKDDYTSRPYVGRYSKNEAYANFKRMVHDARYRDDRPLPDPETWFTETGSPAPGITGHGEDHNEDDDIVMERATISIKCPLTFLPYKDPYTSSKCPHTFERNAIMELIRKSATRIGGGSSRSGEKAVTCPVSGCDQMLTVHDLHHDPILMRKIKRMQQEKAREAEESESEEEREFTVSQQPIRSVEPQIKVSSSRP